jgi:hypothetical protein
MFGSSPLGIASIRAPAPVRSYFMCRFSHDVHGGGPGAGGVLPPRPPAPPLLPTMLCFGFFTKPRYATSSSGCS